MRTPIEAQQRYGRPWKPARFADEAELLDRGPVVFTTGDTTTSNAASGNSLRRSGPFDTLSRPAETQQFSRPYCAQGA